MRVAAGAHLRNISGYAKPVAMRSFQRRGCVRPSRSSGRYCVSSFITAALVSVCTRTPPASESMLSAPRAHTTLAQRALPRAVLQRARRAPGGAAMLRGWARRCSKKRDTQRAAHGAAFGGVLAVVLLGVVDHRDDACHHEKGGDAKDGGVAHLRRRRRRARRGRGSLHATGENLGVVGSCSGRVQREAPTCHAQAQRCERAGDCEDARMRAAMQRDGQGRGMRAAPPHVGLAEGQLQAATPGRLQRTL